VPTGGFNEESKTVIDRRSHAAAQRRRRIGADDEERRSAGSRACRATERAGREGSAGDQKASTKKGPETIGQAPKAPESDKSEMKKSQTMDKASPAAKGSSDANGSTDVKAKANEKASENAGAKESAPASAKPAGTAGTGATTGQGAAAVSAKLSTEQRSKITTIIRSHKVEPVKLNVTVSVGTRVPDSVHFYPLPAEVFVVYPEWRGYDYILVGDEILVIDPRTHQIVAIIEA
jgi:Protein of unknown function (DUF1236)